MKKIKGDYPALGHHFDANMKCSWCNLSWAAHQNNPSPCEVKQQRAQNGMTRGLLQIWRTGLYVGAVEGFLRTTNQHPHITISKHVELHLHDHISTDKGLYKIIGEGRKNKTNNDTQLWPVERCV